MVDTRWYLDRDESPSIVYKCMCVSGNILNINWYWFWLSDVSHVGSRLRGFEGGVAAIGLRER